MWDHYPRNSSVLSVFMDHKNKDEQTIRMVTRVSRKYFNSHDRGVTMTKGREDLQTAMMSRWFQQNVLSAEDAMYGCTVWSKVQCTRCQRGSQGPFQRVSVPWASD